MTAAAVGPLWQRLSLASKGFVVGAAALGAGAPEVAALLVDVESAACGAVLRALAALTDAQRTATVAALAAELNAPVPAGLGGVHGDWLRAALDGEATPVLRALAVAPPAAVGAVITAIIEARGDHPAHAAEDDAMDPDALAELQRAVFVDLVALPIFSSEDAADGARPAWHALAAAGTDAVLATIARQGAETLGISLRGAPHPVIARAAAQIGQGGARQLLDAATARGPATARDAARAVTGAVIPDDAGFDPAQVIGTHALATSLAAENDDAPVALAQRLPLALGALLLRAADRQRPPALAAISVAQPRLK